MRSTAVAFFCESPETVRALQTAPKGGKNAAPVRSERIARFIKESPILAQLKAMLTHINLFEAMGGGEKEVRHSRLLAWLLDPRLSHGCGNTYLKRFLNAVLEEDGDSLDDYKLDLNEFRAECEDDRIDILLINEASRFVCAIENKVHSEQRPGQLETYRKRLEARFPQYVRKLIFLTLRNEIPDDPEWIPCRYGRVLKAMLGSDPDRMQPRDTLGLLLDQYADWIRAGGEPEAANFFHALQLARHELRHSDFLAWLADPQGSHGLNDAFARWLIGKISKVQAKSLPTGAENMNWSDLEVRREFANIDVLLLSERNRVVIVVENKVRAKERERQLGDYRDFVRRHFAHDHLVLLFLDMQGRASAEGTAVNFCYSDLLPFFDQQIANLAPNPKNRHAHLIEEYRRFLETKLWIRKKTTWQAPSKVEALVEQIAKQNPAELGGLLEEVAMWKQSMAAELGAWLLKEATKMFGSKVAVCHKRSWFSFVPEEYDSLNLLRSSGGDADPVFDDRLLIYQFFVIPFGDNVSVRPPQLALDVKLLKAKPNGDRLKEHLHTAAKAKPLFNRVRGSKPSGFNHLLNHELLRSDEIARYEEDELKVILRRRLQRFQKSIHTEIV
ncbi:MAG: hypothetical protein QOD99_2950, partial [Chthoniobacter sp.]|nr:hypothetical protein [Chthoniobacter sp.]